MPADQTVPSEIEYPDGSTRELTFDESGHIESIKVTALSEEIILDHQYEYDERGNITARKTASGNCIYRYDEFSRLTEIIKDGNTVEKYAYDESGNRLISAEAENWKYGPENQLLGYGGTVYEYDSRGNTVKMVRPGEIQNYIHDAEDCLIEVRDGSERLIAKYTYDEQGRRIRKEVLLNPSPLVGEGAGEGELKSSSSKPLIKPVEMNANNISLIEPVEMTANNNPLVEPVETTPPSEITHYHYTDEGILLSETDAQGSEITSWTYDPYSGISAEPLFMKHKGKRYVFHNDHLGTPQKITDAKGNIVWSAAYDAFGKAEIDPASTITNNLRFPGQYCDSETGLHYNIHRYYNPATGRYLSKDPLKIVAEGSNFYSYANANPLRFYDYLGLFFGNAHRWFLGRQFPRLKSKFFRAMAQASDKVDENQRLAASFMHYMRDPKDQEPMNSIHTFIRENIKNINQLTTEDDFKPLGSALHCLQDYTAMRHVLNGKLQVFPIDMTPKNVLKSFIPIIGIPYGMGLSLAIEHAVKDVTQFMTQREFAYDLYSVKWRYELAVLKLEGQIKIIEKVMKNTQEGAGWNIWTGTKEEWEQEALDETIQGKRW